MITEMGIINFFTSAFVSENTLLFTYHLTYNFSIISVKNSNQYTPLLLLRYRFFAAIFRVDERL